MPKSQLSWIRSQHPPAQWNLRGADETVMNKVLKNLKNPPEKNFKKEILAGEYNNRRANSRLKVFK
jgi:hypothetical protein